MDGKNEQAPCITNYTPVVYNDLRSMQPID
jgi:hypothetical protein